MGFINMKEILGVIGLTSAIAIIAYALSWGITCFLIWLVTLCFGLDFSLIWATGIWLIIIILKGVCNTTVKITKD